MVWFKVDDGLYDHPKVRRMPPARRRSAIGTWVLAGAWCARQLTDGYITTDDLRHLGGTTTDADALVKAELWEAVPGGYRFKHWDEYQPLRSKVERRRQATAERTARWRERQQLGDDPDAK